MRPPDVAPYPCHAQVNSARSTADTNRYALERRHRLIDRLADGGPVDGLVERFVDLASVGHRDRLFVADGGHVGDVPREVGLAGEGAVDVAPPTPAARAMSRMVAPNPPGDTLIVLRNAGTRTPPFGIHFITAVVALLSAALLFADTDPKL